VNLDIIGGKASVAQPAEQRFRKPQVKSSILFAGSILLSLETLYAEIELISRFFQREDESG
jgi:hypothetical protein